MIFENGFLKIIEKFWQKKVEIAYKKSENSIK